MASSRGYRNTAEEALHITMDAPRDNDDEDFVHNEGEYGGDTSESGSEAAADISSADSANDGSA